MIVAIYVRVSTDSQAEHGYSLAEQLDQGHIKAKFLGITLTEEFIDDGYSGAYLERPALDRLREGLREKRFSHVIVLDPDRLARNLAHQLLLTEEIDKSGAQLVFISFTWEKTPEGMLFYSMRGAISAYEREKIKQRTTSGKRKKAKEGKVVRNNQPYGYRWDAKNSTYIINESEAEAVKEVFSCIVDRKLGLRAVAERIASLGYLTRTGKTSWCYTTIRDMVYNEIYSGTHWANRRFKTKIGQKQSEYGYRDPSEWIAVSVPAIVPREIQTAAWEQLKLNRNETKRPREYPYLCRGLVICGLCGNRLRALINGNWNKANPIPYYVCQTGKGYINGSFGPEDERCPARSIPAQNVDLYVWEKLSRLLKHLEELRQEFGNRGQEDSTVRILKGNLERLEAKEAQLLREQEKIALLFRQDLLNQESAEKQLNEIRLTLKSLTENKKVLQSEISRLDNSEELEQTISKFKAFAHLADSQDMEERRAAIKALVKAVEAVRTDRSNGGKAYRLELKINIRF